MIRHALLFTAPRTIEIISEPLPPPAADQLVVQTVCSAISAGTELLIWRGESPADLATDATLPALSGALTWPLKYGYSAVGRVIATGSAIDASLWHDRLVFAFNPHETHFLATSENLWPVPETLPPAAATLLPTLETALSLVLDARPLIGERVMVIGQGMVGALVTLLLAQMPLGRLLAVDRDTTQLDYAKRLGAETGVAGEESADFDLVIEVSGNPAALNSAIRSVGYGGRVVIGSWYGTKSASLDLGGAFHRNHIRLISSQVSTLSPPLRGRWDKERRLTLAWQLLARYRPDSLITHHIPFRNAPAAWHLLDTRPEPIRQLILDY
jgi:2-desacetyl-2-hydroxyethyl bacteriochlorophyllide A dehydrogenase